MGVCDCNSCVVYLHCPLHIKAHVVGLFNTWPGPIHTLCGCLIAFKIKGFLAARSSRLSLLMRIHSIQ